MRQCIVCGGIILLDGNKENKKYFLRKYCSSECRRIFWRNKYLENNPSTQFKASSTHTTGTISELRVAIDLMMKGYEVFRALSPASPCDLAVLKNKHLLRIQVRTTHITLTGNLYNRKSRKDDISNIDIYAWVLPDKIVYEPELE